MVDFFTNDRGGVAAAVIDDDDDATIVIVGANVTPLLHSVRMYVPKGCLQISFFTV